jgi:DNA-binding MarR family transcriptional regulator
MPDRTTAASQPLPHAHAPAPAPYDRIVRPATAEVRQALRELVRAHQSRERALAGACGLTPTAAHALQTLATLGDITVGQLAGELVVERSTASRIASGLEEKGYLEYVTEARDRRFQHLRITAEGRKMHHEIEERALREMAAVLRPYGPTVRRTLGRRLRELAERTAELDEC